MAKVLTILKVVPNTVELDKEALKKRLMENYNKDIPVEVLQINEEPLHFGLVAFKVAVRTTDDDDGAEALEEYQSRVEQDDVVENVEVEMQTLSHAD